jgi:hypothetical protein
MSESTEQNKETEKIVKIEEPIVVCPHCKEPILIEKLNCGIFRHGVLKVTGQQMAPHLDKYHCDSLKERDLIYGCGKPFQVKVDENQLFFAEECGYI